jgi:hypothetical protein
VHSFFSERMNLSTMAVLPYLPTVPKRGRMPPLRRHHRLNASHQNWRPLSVMMYLGELPTLRMARSSSAPSLAPVLRPVAARPRAQVTAVVASEMACRRLDLRWAGQQAGRRASEEAETRIRGFD